MGGIIDDLKLSVERMKKTVVKNHRLTESSLVLMKHVNARVDAMLELCKRAGVIKDHAEFDMLVDHNLGLRLKTAEEEIVAGDVCFVKYTGKDTVTGEEFGDEIPVRIGPNVIVFEKDLVGLKPGMTGIKRSYDFPEHKKHIEFTIDILKVKTRIEGAKDDGHGDDEGGGEGVEASLEAEAHSDGGDNGSEQHGDGGSVQSIKPEGDSGEAGAVGEVDGGEHGVDQPKET